MNSVLWRKSWNHGWSHTWNLKSILIQLWIFLCWTFSAVKKIMKIMSEFMLEIWNLSWFSYEYFLAGHYLLRPKIWWPILCHQLSEAGPADLDSSNIHNVLERPSEPHPPCPLYAAADMCSCSCTVACHHRAAAVQKAQGWKRLSKGTNLRALSRRSN